MSCSYGNRYFCQAQNFETCQNEECTVSKNSLHHLCQIKYEEDNEIDRETHECFWECAENKHKIRAAMNIEEAELLDANNNLENPNKGKIKISNK